MMNPDSARFGARTQSNILTPHFGQVNPAMAGRVGTHTMKPFGTVGRAVNPALQRPGMQATRTPAGAQKANNGVMLVGLLVAGTLAGIAWRNTKTIAPMVKKALEENNKNVANATKTSGWGYAKDALLGTLGLTGTSFGLYGSFKKIEDKAATTVANEAKALATNAETKVGGLETKVGGFDARLQAAETKVGAVDTRMNSAEYGIGELAYRVDNIYPLIDDTQNPGQKLPKKGHTPNLINFHNLFAQSQNRPLLK